MSRRNAGKKDKYTEERIEGARDKRDAARQLLSKDIDPGAQRSQLKTSLAEAKENCVEAIAREWHGIKSIEWAPSTAPLRISRLEKHAFSYIGKCPIQEVAAAEILQLLRRIEKHGKHELTHRVRAMLSQVYRYAIATGRARRQVSGAEVKKGPGFRSGKRMPAQVVALAVVSRTSDRWTPGSHGPVR